MTCPQQVFIFHIKFSDLKDITPSLDASASYHKLKSRSNQKNPTKTKHRKHTWLVAKNSILDALSNCYYLNIHLCSGLKDYMPSQGHK